MLLMGAKGENRYLENWGYFEIKENYVNYLDPDQRSCLEKVRGVIVNPPSASIMDVYYDSRHYLENDQKVLVVVGDGFTYDNYTQAIAKGQLSFLSNAVTAVKAVGVYPQGRNIWLAAMITGIVPEKNGVISPQDQDLEVPSLFAIAGQLQKPALLLHAGPRLLNTETEPQLVNDENADKTADAELYSMALDQMEQGYDFMMLCLDDITDDQSAQYLQEIVTRWPGKVIITGVPKDTAQDFTCDSMFVPYLYFK